MGRKILAVIAGIIAGSLTIFLFETVGHLIVPPPAGMDATNVESIRAAMSQMTLASFLLILAAWCGGSFVGGLVAAAIARTDGGRGCALIVAGFIVLSGIATMILIPHPIWFWIAGIVLPFPCALAGARLVARRSAAAAATA